VKQNSRFIVPTCWSKPVNSVLFPLVGFSSSTGERTLFVRLIRPVCFSEEKVHGLIRGSGTHSTSVLHIDMNYRYMYELIIYVYNEESPRERCGNTVPRVAYRYKLLYMQRKSV